MVAANSLLSSLHIALVGRGARLLMRLHVLSLASLLVIPLFVSTTAAAAPSLSGTYKISEITDLGSEIRLNLQLNLFNVGDATVKVSRISLRSISVPGQLTSASSNVVVDAHSNSEVALEFVIAKRDFEAWQVGPHQHFLVALQPTGGRVSQVHVLLLRTQG